MKAIVYEKYGSPEVLEYRDVEKPTPKDNEVLVKVYASSANAIDWRAMRGKPIFFRFEMGFPNPKHTILGADLAGMVVEVGSSVTQFKIGDEIFGDIGDYSLSCFAEYACAPEELIALKPKNMTYEEAATVPLTAVTALQGLRHHGQIQPGQKVLINGASGGVGTFAVQIAKSFGAEVTGVCSTSKMDIALSIGADHVIDYTKEDFTKNGQQYDLIFDIAANRSASEYLRALNPNGKCVIIGFSTISHMVFQVGLIGSLLTITGNKKIGTMGSAVADQKDLLFIKELIETGKVVPVIDRRYPLSETAEAIRYLEEGHAKGKVVITMDHSDNN